MASPTFQVTGVEAVASALRQVDKGLAKELQKEFKEIAVHVVGVARGKMEFGSGPASNSLRPRATAKGASILRPRGMTRAGKAPYYPFLDFGGSTGRGHKIRKGGSGAIKRPMPKGGRYLYPAIGESTEFIREHAIDAVLTTARHAGFETRG